MTDPPHPPPFLASLTPAALSDLRGSVRVRCGDGTFAKAVPPFMCLTAEGDRWELHAYGKVQARAADPNVILACIYRECHEPGWIAYALSTAADPEEAAADGHERQRRELDRATREAVQQARAEAAERVRAERAANARVASNLASLSLTDLLGD